MSTVEEQIAQLEAAIAHLEAQRSVLGDTVVETALAPLTQQLSNLHRRVIAGPTPPLRGERRLVTVMFADISGFTAMAGTADAEAVRDLMNDCFDWLVPIVEEYEGRVDKFIGDEIMALFGAPVAHENDPERALRAAVGMKDVMAAFNAERGTNLGLHFGVNTGFVVAGGIGTRGRQRYSVIGDAVNLAARLKDASVRGEILVGPDTYRLTEPLFEFEALEPIPVKGKTGPVPVYRVLAPRAVPGRLRGIAGLESPLVGRQTEYRALQETVERLRAGEGGIVTLVGEAGLGKSRLVAELREQIYGRSSSLESPGLRWVEGRCLSYGTSTAYLLWLDVLRGLMGVTAEDTSDTIRDALRDHVRSLCPDRYETVYPYLGRLMAMPLTAGEEATPHDLEDVRPKSGTFRAVESLLEGAAHQCPTVVVCEDLHWASPTSVELLEQLLALADRAPLLLICVFRPETEHGCRRIKNTAARLYRHRHTNLWLAPLSAADTETLVVNLLRVEGLPQKLKWRILSHAEGNPFYVEEIIRSLIDSEAIVWNETRGRWRASWDVTDIAIPDTVHGVLLARIDHLQEDTRRVLQLAAVVGRIFPHRVLAAIAIGERELDEHLLILEREGMIRERARVPELEYIFKHHLTREAAYNGLLRKERRAIHQRVAEALERLYPERVEEQAGLLAAHWEQAGEPEKAIGHLLQAGDRARRLGASLQAVDFYRTALDKAGELNDRGAAVESPRIHERLGDVLLVNLSRPEEALEYYASFLALAQSEQDKARGEWKIAGVHMLRGDLAEAQRCYETALARLSSLPPLPEGSRVHHGLSHLLTLRNRWGEAAQHASASLKISQRIGDTRGLADAYRVMSAIAAQRGNLEAACEYDESCLKLYRKLGDLPRLAQACNNLGDTYRLMGMMDRALEHLNEGIELACRLGDTRDEAILLQTTAELFLDQGRWEAAIAHLERALPLAEESGVAAYLIEVRRLLGSTYESAGRLEEARCQLEMAETLGRDTQHLRFVPRIYLALARLSATQDEFGEAETYLRLAMESAGPEPSSVFLGLAERCYGYLDGRRSDWDGAVRHLEESARLLEGTNLPAEMGKARLSLGTAYADRGREGDSGRACEHLLTAQSIFHQIQGQAYLAQVSARLRELECESDSPGALLDGDRSPTGKAVAKQ